MNNNIYDENNMLTDQQFRAEIISSFEKQLPMLSGDINQAVSAAYAIAGLMATPYARSLENDDPIDEILTIAGELEINPNNAEELREELVSKIKVLLQNEPYR